MEAGRQRVGARGTPGGLPEVAGVGPGSLTCGDPSPGLRGRLPV